MIWPTGLRSKTTRWLRRGGPRMFGVRADGEVADEATLYLVHYQSTPARGVILDVKGDVSKLSAGPVGLVAAMTTRRGQLVVEFATPVIAGQAIELELHVDDRSATAPLFFNHVEWQF